MDDCFKNFLAVTKKYQKLHVNFHCHYYAVKNFQIAKATRAPENVMKKSRVIAHVVQKLTYKNRFS